MKTSPLARLKDPSLLRTDALINGQWVQGAARFDVSDPSTGLRLADVSNLGSKDAEAAIAAANAANVGVLATEHVPFGDVKQSGLGREGSHHGMDDYVEIKYLCIGDIQK